MDRVRALVKKFAGPITGIAGLAAAIDLAWHGYKDYDHRPETIRKRFLEAMRVPVEPFKLKPKETFVKNERLEAYIRAPLLNRTCGVQVLFATPGSGKSTASRHVVRQLQDANLVPGAMAIDLRALNLNMENSSSAQSLFGRILLREAGMADTKHFEQALSDIFEGKETEASDKRYVILIDQFELLSNRFEDRHLKLLLKGLATDAARSDSYVVLITVSDKDLYDKIVGTPDRDYLNGWNNNEKITPVIADPTVNTTPPNADLERILELHCKHNKTLAKTPLAKDKDLQTSMVKQANGSVGRLITLKDAYLENLDLQETIGTPPPTKT